MQKLRRITIFPLLFLGVPSIWAAAPFDGDWIGGFERPNSQVDVQPHFETTTNGTTGTIDVVDLGDSSKNDIGKPLDQVELTPSHVHFELADKVNNLSFDGQVTNGVITGVVQDSQMKLPFHLDLVAKINPSRYAGIYQVGPGHFISIGNFFSVEPNGSSSLLSFDAQSGQIRLLLPRSTADFVCGPGLKTYPAEAAIHFVTNRLGRVTGLQWKPKNATAMVGTRIKALQQEEVSFTNGDVTLSGTLVLPPAKGPHPAIVLVCGSGSQVRGDARFYADFFALNGVAALIYDKRGCGRSTGDLSTFTYDDLAGDALAGLERLKNRPDINPRQTGLWSASEGGWIVPLAASRCADVAFVINGSGPGVTPEAVGVYLIENWIKAAGYSESDIHEALALWQLNSRGGNEFEAARNADRNKPWFNACYIFADDADVSATRRQWGLMWNYDPVPALRKVHCPVLSIYGELDSHVPPKKSAKIWKTALTKAGNHDVVIKMVPNAEHGVTDPRNGLPLPVLFTLQRDWLLKHVTVNN